MKILVKRSAALKDLWAARGLYVDDLLGMNEREAEKYVKKDNVWKKPDYNALIQSGVPVDILYFRKVVRDSLNASRDICVLMIRRRSAWRGRKNISQPSGRYRKPLKRFRQCRMPWACFDALIIDGGYCERISMGLAAVISGHPKGPG